MNQDVPGSSRLPRGLKESLVVGMLCLCAIARCLIYSAALPFFNNSDEDAHFDMVVRFSQGSPPHGQGPFTDESRHFLVHYASLEYFGTPRHIEEGKVPPPLWEQTPAARAAQIQHYDATSKMMTNHEAAQTPLYYAMAGSYWRLGRALRLKPYLLLYGIRFLNAFILGATVWLGYVVARTVFPDRLFIRLGVPALLAFMPQSVFFVIENDVLSPITFGLVFLYMVRWLRGEVLTQGLAVNIGCALAALFLTKLSNLPQLTLAVGIVALQTSKMSKTGALRPQFPALALLILCAVIPALSWMAWTKHAFGDFLGAAAKIEYLGWTPKPLGECHQHPIFTVTGLCTFFTHLLGSFWQGELFWHGEHLAPLSMAIFYAVLTFCLVGLAVAGLCLRKSTLEPSQRLILWWSLGSVLAGVAFLAILSMLYDFHDCPYPSRQFPYFTNGRLIIGTLIPFALVCLFGIDQVAKRSNTKWVAPALLVSLILFMFISEIVIQLPVFLSRFNLYHALPHI